MFDFLSFYKLTRSFNYYRMCSVLQALYYHCTNNTAMPQQHFQSLLLYRLLPSCRLLLFHFFQLHLLLSKCAAFISFFACMSAATWIDWKPPVSWDRFCLACFYLLPPVTIACNKNITTTKINKTSNFCN